MRGILLFVRAIALEGEEILHFTGDLKGDAAIEPDATLPLLARGACATLGIVNVVDYVVMVLFVGDG